MNFNLNSPGLIIVSQFKTRISKENINYYWYIATEGIEYLKNNNGVLSHINLSTDCLLDIILKHYKAQFEFTFEKVDLGFFAHWSCLQIQTFSTPKKSDQNNFSNFLINLNIDYKFDELSQTYCFKDYPKIITQLDVYHFINEQITKDLSFLFQTQNIANCVLTDIDYLNFDKYENKIDFLEKFRFKKQLEKKLPIKNLTTINKI